MPENADDPLSFFQELKRRKVIRVIIVYAAAAFAILELVSIIAEPFGLPDWTIKFVFVILCIGLIISIILSWIYDIHPERGIVKTEPAHKVKPEDIPKSSNSWKIASYISFVVIIGLIVLNLIPRSNRKKILDKSIAVLPFKNDSPDEEKMYFINGTMEAILDNLCKIKDLRVVSRTSTEQYRNVDKTTPVIAREMNVGYLLEGSGQKIGNRVLLTVQLIDGVNDHHIWSKKYDREIQKVEDLIEIQSEISQLVAGEIEAIITPKEKKLIEKIPTLNLTAYNFYQRGREEHVRYFLDHNDFNALERAEDYYGKALECDSTFAKAYIGLNRIYFNRNYSSSDQKNKMIDSILSCIDVALSLDDQEEEAYLAKAVMYELKGDFQQAEENFEIALNINPNFAEGLRNAGIFYAYDLEDYIKGISCLHKATSIDRSPYLALILRNLALVYRNIGFIDKAIKINQELVKVDIDSTSYYLVLAISEFSRTNHAAAEKSLLKAYTTNTDIIRWGLVIGRLYLFLGQYEQLLRFSEKYIALMRDSGRQLYDGDHYWLGLAYWINGNKKEAEYYFSEQIKNSKKAIELGLLYARQYYAYFDLASVYACKGDRDKAIENLRIYNQKQRVGFWLIQLIENDPAFDNIRNDPEFQQILSDLQAKYQAEHERVRKWLEENDML